ncbi:MAG: cytochrome c [Hyphomicrobiales bacterium]
MKIKYIVIMIALLGLGKIVWDMATPQGTMPMQQAAQSQMKIPKLSGLELAGKTLFDANCASCHGKDAVGVEGAGPTFIHKIYEPNHHADGAFYLAAKNGVRPHHWPYGPMPKQPQVNEADVKKIIAYIRKLQQANGIF